MAYPLKLTSILTGATPHQLNSWRSKGLVVPEVRPYRPPLYSFRDIVALRSMVFLRSQVSLQKITRAFANLDLFDLTDHPSKYHFGTDGETIYVRWADDRAMDLVKRPGQSTLFTFEDVIRPFHNFRDQEVVPLDHPAEHIEVRYARMGGWPTIEGTRVPYDVVADLVDGVTITSEDVSDFYPGVSAEAARSALAFRDRVEAVGAA